MDLTHTPPTTTTTTTTTSNNLLSYLANLSPHTWYDYTSTPALALELTPSSPTKPHKPKPCTHLLPSDILTLATLLPSTRPLLLSQKFLKALDLTPEETATLTKSLKEQQPSLDKLGGGAVAKHKSKLEQLRERELQLAKEEAKEEAKAEKKKEVKRRREIDHALGLAGKGKGAGRGGKGKTYGKPPAATVTTTITTTATDGDQGKQLQDEKKEENDEAEQESAEQRKKRKIQELDRYLGLLPTEDDSPDEGRASMPELVDIERTQSTHIDTGDAAAIRRAGIDVLLGLVGNNATLGDEHEPHSEEENDLMNKAEVTRRRIDAEMGLLNSSRIAQMDAILGLLSPRKTGTTRD